MVSMIDAAALPQIVFFTDYDEHALKAFEEHAADYLLKPIDPQRNVLPGRATGCAREYTTRPGHFRDQPKSCARFPVSAATASSCWRSTKWNSSTPTSPAYRSSATSGRGTTELSLKILQERTSLMRCHRQFLVNLDQIAEIEWLATAPPRSHPQRQKGAGQSPPPARDEGKVTHCLSKNR